MQKNEIDALLAAHCHAMNNMTAQERSEIIDIAEFIQVKPFFVLIKQAVQGSRFFILLSGEILVTCGGTSFPITYKTGEIVGEMSLFYDQITTGEVIAKTDCTLLAIDHEQFSSMVLNHHRAAVKLMSRLGTMMVERLQAQDKRLLESSQTDAALASYSALKKKLLADWSLKYHSLGRKGKLEIVPTKSCGTAQDLSVAYSPGVAEPCLAIYERPQAVYEYTTKGNLVGVISNGSAVLGLGNIGALASKPVMEGKSVLFKRFADIDAFDIEIEQTDTQSLIDTIVSLAPTFGGINLEDIKAPECFEIEQQCQQRMSIPVFHDDQHGTAIIAGAGLLNALVLTGKSIDSIKVVFSGAGAAGFSCAKHFLTLGMSKEQIIMTDIDGVIYQGRGDENYLAEMAANTEHRTLEQAIQGADVFVGVSVGGLLRPAMLQAMNKNPVVFALANPVPEIDYTLAKMVRNDAIIATGRSDFPNQINNVLAFPYLFRAALDGRASCVNQAMKVAATHGIANLAQRSKQFSTEYVIPRPFDPELLISVATSVMTAAIESGVAAKPWQPDEYKAHLEKLSQQIMS